LGALPLTVLERSEGADESFHIKQRELAGLSSSGKLIKAEKSAHMIHLYRPDLVIEAIQNVAAACRRL
jgi:pimeloyl-ACP methyl ester carboxylesterase